ncbi:MAG: exosome non-catalytic core subunit rrp40 [Thelocarpon impressellum]|nr:MAG: exosome non-catalytic core subunit rrp40 [Thelocarpon impressellum]
MSSAGFFMPGDAIPPHLLPVPSNPAIPLKLGPGLRHIPPETITPTVAGELCVDGRKNAVWVENNGGRYIPTVGDTILATIHHSSPDLYHCIVTPYTPLATLPQLAFPGASKKTRPMLSPGSLVYARVSLASKHLEPELECVKAATGKADGLGELKGGMVFDVSLGFARRLMMPDVAGQGGVVLLEELAERVPFEMAVGRNGRVWVDAMEVRKTLAVGSALVQVDASVSGVEEQRALVKRLLKGL